MLGTDLTNVKLFKILMQKHMKWVQNALGHDILLRQEILLNGKHVTRTTHVLIIIIIIMQEAVTLNTSI